MLGKAIAIASAAFEHKTDRGGHPYILHCLHVMHKVGQQTRHDRDIMCIAVLHDLVEDTDWTIDGLREAGFNDRVLDGVACMTHSKDEPYEVYIDRIAECEDAKIVKRADLKHNTDITRMKGVRQKDFDRLVKYHKAYARLKA